METWLGMKRFLLIAMILIGAAGNGLCATVSGHAYLAGQSDHSGINVTLDIPRAFPALSLPGICLLLLVIGFLMLRRHRVAGIAVLLSVFLPGSAMIMNAGVTTATQTNPDGSYVFTDVAPGRYFIMVERDCHLPATIDSFDVAADDVVVDPITLEGIGETNELLTVQNIKDIYAAQVKYNNRSYPHTYSGNLACLASGNGAYGWDFLAQELGDGVADGYQFQAAVSAPDGSGSSWAWSMTAFPVTYQCTGNKSFYIDEVHCPGKIVQGEDIGGGPGDGTLSYICPGNKEENLYESMKEIMGAETDYRNNANPHTYTAPLANLVNDGLSFLCPDFEDNLVCDYQFQMGLGDPDPYGSIWTWSCTAWPVVYGGDTRLTFYVDEHRVIRAGDIGGAPGDDALPEYCGNEDQQRFAHRMLDEIATAQMNYNEESSPHTYTGELACLASGNGGGGHPLLNGGLADGAYCGYQYSLTADGPTPGSNWHYYCSAWPVAYNSETRRSFFVDETGFVRGSDNGGLPGDISLPVLCEVDDIVSEGVRRMQNIAAGETDYNYNSSPHTYTGELACLASGWGAGRVGFIPPNIADGEGCYYRYELGISQPIQGSSWSWSCTAWPVFYGADSCVSFYADETNVIRGSDVGGGPGSLDLPCLY